MIIGFHRNFYKGLLSLTKKEQDRFYERLGLFEKDVHSPLLNNHSLNGKYEGYRSISVSGDLRAVYKNISFDTVIFVKIGTHSKLYS